MIKDKDNWLTWAADDWQLWLRAEIEKRKQVFQSDPDELIAGFNREKSQARDYHGRELIELIQNADDSGINYGKPNRLLIKLTETGLFVANTGVPFSPGGIKSLMVSDNSPKQLLWTKCIGYKGLGFRSILGWASSIIILSGKLQIGFNEKRAALWLEDLSKQDQKIDEKIKEYAGLGFPTPIATLSVPFLISQEDVQSGGETNLIFNEGQDILKQEYDSVICLSFKDAQKTREQVQKQIMSLGREILLFLQFLESIKIQSPDRTVQWKIQRNDIEIVVNPGASSSETWKIFKREGVIPAEFLKPEQILHNKFEIKLAVPQIPPNVNKLFVFFPTEVRFPFPLITHATFEVGDNRQHLIDSEVNRFIAEQLADLMADAAEKIKNPTNPWYALSLISPRGDIDPVLEKFDFLNLLIERVKKYAIVPVRNNCFKTAAETKRIRGNFDDLLISDVFRDLCIHAEHTYIQRQLIELGVSEIEYEELRKRLNSISGSLTLEQRAKIIYCLIENNLITGIPPELLIDSDQQKIYSQSTVFLPPEGKVFTLPAWVPQRLLHADLVLLLKGKFDVSRVRDLASKLGPFHVQEYNLTAFVSAIQAETNRRCKENPDKELTLRQQAIQLIWNLYSSNEEKVKLTETISIILPVRDGSFKSAKDLYFGEEYRAGKILEYIFANIKTASFVACPENIGFASEQKGVEDFLSWLGVNQNLRYFANETGFPNRQFQNYIISSLKFPAKFDEITIEDEKKLKAEDTNLKNVGQIDNLEEILATADPHAILCWIATNHDIESWRIEGDKSTTFEVRPHAKQLYRKLSNQKIPSHPLWLLKTTAWLPTEGGKRLPPVKCCLDRGVKDISPIIGFPAVDMEHPLIKELNLDTTAIEIALNKIGVVNALDKLPPESFYEILLELPKIDPAGAKAKSIYRRLFTRTETEVVSINDKYKEFLKQGKMLGKKNGKLEYYPVSQLYYLENITLPQNIADQYPLLEFDRRRGADKIKRIFGVEQLTTDKIQIEIVSSEEHPCSKNFQDEVERLKPYIYAMRVEEDINRIQLNTLRRFKINLCRSTRVAMLIDKNKREIDLQNGDSINIDSSAYLVAEPSDYTRPLLEDHFIADSIGEIISNILKVDINQEVVNIATCPVDKRDSFLDRITGGSGSERLIRAKELFKFSEDKESPFAKPHDWRLPEPRDTSQKPILPIPAEKTADTEPSESPIGDISVSDKGNITPVQKQLVLRKIQHNAKTNNPSHHKKRVDPDHAEMMARRFEESEQRYPILVSQLRGEQSYGCDVLSFRSVEDKNIFQNTYDLNLIDRFIEVKGSSSEKGSIILKGNQLRSAQEYKERFFIYRIYEDEDTGIYDLVMINDPLSCKREALEPQYEVNPFRSAKAHLWEIEEKQEVQQNERVYSEERKVNPV